MKPGRILSPTVARLADSGAWWLMSRREKGWASYGLPFDSIEALQRAYAVTLGERGRDDHSEYIEVFPASEATS